MINTDISTPTYHKELHILSKFYPDAKEELPSNMAQSKELFLMLLKLVA